MSQSCQCGNVTDVDRLLALANGAALHKALVKEVPTAKYRTVARWVGARRQQPPAEMIPAILRAFGLDPDTQEEAAPPAWVERLLGGVMALETNADLTADELDEAEAKAVAYLAVVRQRSHGRGGGGAGGAANA